MEMKEKQIAMGESVYLGLIILELSKILMHKMWYSYVKPKNGEKAYLCFIFTQEQMIIVKALQDMLN